MKFAILASALLFAACGGSTLDDSSTDDLTQPSFDPIAAYGSAKDHAARYAANPLPVRLDGAVTSTGIRWTWELVGEGHVYVDVGVSETGARVRSHQVRQLMMPITEFDPASVTVSPADAIQLLASHKKCTTATHLTLGALPTSDHPAWSVTCGGATLSVDAITGDVK